MALVAYRHLLRSTRIAFQGDLPMLHAAREEIKINFRKNRGMLADDAATGVAVKHAEDVAKILLENVVQGKNEGDDKYKMKYLDRGEEQFEIMLRK